MDENKTYEAEPVEEEVTESSSGAGVGLIIGGILGLGVLGLAIYGGVQLGKKAKEKFVERKALAAQAKEAADANQ